MAEKDKKPTDVAVEAMEKSKRFVSDDRDINLTNKPKGKQTSK